MSTCENPEKAGASATFSHPVVVYGATGQTGARVCASLLRRGAVVVAVGRDASKLSALAKRLGGIEVAAAAIEDERRLQQAIDRGCLVINCAGPFARVGKRVQDAALATGRHCLDLAGEPDFVRATLARDEEARRRNVLLVSGIGFDVVPTDALAALLCAALQEPARAARVAYSRLDAGASVGIGLTMLQGLLNGGVAFVDGRWQLERLGRDGWTAPFPEPLGRVACVSMPCGDVASLPRTTGAGTVRTYLPRVFPSAFWASTTLRLLRWVLSARSFARISTWSARTLAARLPLSSAAKPPSAVVEIKGASRTKSGWLTAPPGIAVEAAALCAELVASGSFERCGAETPARAFGARRLLDGLARAGLQWGLQ